MAVAAVCLSMPSSQVREEYLLLACRLGFKPHCLGNAKAQGMEITKCKAACACSRGMILPVAVADPIRRHGSTANKMFDYLSLPPLVRDITKRRARTASSFAVEAKSARTHARAQR